MLGAICVLSPIEGHKAVLAAFSDFKDTTVSEQHRFATLLRSMAIEEAPVDPQSSEELSRWSFRTSAMCLINAITSSPEDLEQRMALRDEFGRRGLNEMMAVCVHLLLLHI